MLNFGIFRSRVLVMGLVAAFVLLLAPMESFSGQAQAPRGGTLTGSLYGPDGKTPVVNATVKIRNLNNQKEYTSPTDNKGEFRIAGIDEGWYTLTVSSVLGDYNLNYGVYIKYGETARMTLAMKGSGVLEGHGHGAAAGGQSFFGTPGGILLIIAAAGGAGFAIYELTKSKPEASPINR
jgi:hypothetical protein